MRLAGVFNHEQIVILRQFLDWIHISRLAVQMNGNNPNDAPLRAAFNQFSTGMVKITPRFQIFTKLLAGSIV